MQILNSVLQSGSIFGHVPIVPWLKDWAVVALLCVIASVGVIYAWLAVSLWIVEDRMPGNRMRVVLVGALVAMVFAFVSAVNHLRDRPRLKV